MFKIFFVVCVGYLTGLCGFLPGMLLSKTINSLGKRFQGTLMGFTGGLLIAFVCFELLPKSFEISGLYLGITWVLIGVFTCVFFEKKKSEILKNINIDNKHLNIGVLLAFGISMHNIPEGMAIGSLMNVSLEAGLRMAIIISIHCLPEATLVSLPFIKAGFGRFKMLVMALIFALPICFGTVLGVLMGVVSPVLISACLGFAGGVMLYITCGEIIPNSKSIWEGGLTTIASTIGFVAGIILSSN